MKVSETITRIVENVERVILGKSEVIKLALAAMLCPGHILFEDVPGTGKTYLARSLAVSIGADFKRIQFTPDLLPSDVTGVSIFNQQTAVFEFREGPLLSQIVLADEINRATPRTQSSLLEAMAEGQVTVEGISRKLPEPFIVMATQNPIEYDGTFPLPEAQLDRFLVRLHLGYPGLAEEVEILASQQYKHPLESLTGVITTGDFLILQKSVREVYLKPELQEYTVRLVRATRENPDLILGASPRGSLGIVQMSRAWAAIQGRDYVIPDDIKKVAPFVLNHRLILSPEAGLKGVTVERITADILQWTAVTGD